MREFVMGFVESLDIENKKSRMALVTFSDVIKLEFHLNKYDNRLDILEHIERMPYSRGSTNTAKALEFVTDTMFTQVTIQCLLSGFIQIKLRKCSGYIGDLPHLGIPIVTLRFEYFG